MESKTLAATATTTTDQGEFTALAAAWTIDRERDVIHRGAFAGTIKHWQESGKRLPLHWDHRGEPQNIIGHVDPSSMQETDDGLVVKGKVDIEGSDVARQAWRAIKNGSVGLSFGYLATKKQDRVGGGRDLHEIDVFEISITPAPMHPDTRILEAKSEDVLRRESQQLERELISEQLPDVQEPEAEEKGAASVGPAARAHLHGLIEYYMKKPHPFTACVRDNTKRFGKDGAERVCATLKDIGEGTTKWRNQPGKSVEPDWEQVLYDAADGNLEGLLEMWHEWTAADGEPPKSITSELEERFEKLEALIEKSLRRQETNGSRPADPIRRHSEQVALGIQSGGVSLRKSPLVTEPPKAQAPPEDSLRRETRDLYMEILNSAIGVGEDDAQ